MSIRSVTYYQAVCDICGTVDDGGDYSAFSASETAQINATECTEWREITWRGGDYLVCNDHSGDGVDWCAACDDDLDLDGWSLVGGVLVQSCENGHESRIEVHVPADTEADS